MRKLVSLLLALVMLGTMVAIPAMAETAQDPLTVTVFVGEARDQPTSDNKIFKKIEEEFGLKFEFEFLAGDLDETLGVKIAGQDYADLMDGGNSAEKLIEAGALVNLMDYINETDTPNLYAYIKPYLKRLLNDKGELFIVPNYGRYYNTEDYGRYKRANRKNAEARSGTNSPYLAGCTCILQKALRSVLSQNCGFIF